MPTVKTFIIASIAGLFTNQMMLFNFYGVIDNAPYIATIGYFIYSKAAPGPSNWLASTKDGGVWAIAFV